MFSKTSSQYALTIHVLCHYVARPYHLMRLQYMYYDMTSRDLTALCAYNTCTMPLRHETLPPYALTIHVQCHYVTRPYRLRRLKYFYYAMTWNLIPHLACTINVLCHNVAGPYCLMHLQYMYYAIMSRDLTALCVYNTCTMSWRRETLPPYALKIHVLCHDVARPYRLMRLKYFYYAMTSWDLIPPIACTINVLCHNVAGPYRLICSQYMYYVMTSQDLTALCV